MPSRDDVVKLAMSFNGYLDGHGYDTANQFSADLGRPAEAYCADFVTDVYKRVGLPLPRMGNPTGFAYVPDGMRYAQNHNAFAPSYQAERGDAVCFDWNNDGTADHVELATEYDGTTLYTIGGNSGPSNVDQYQGTGGVHRHIWATRSPTGNPLIAGVIKMQSIVSFGGAARPTPPAAPPATNRTLMLKSPWMSGPDVLRVQRFLDPSGGHLEHGSAFGPRTRDAVRARQRAMHLPDDGIIGARTWHGFETNGM